MRRTEGIVFALTPFGEARKPAALAQCADAIAPPCQNLMRIGLVPDIPDQPVMRCVKNRMHRDGQFHHPKRCAKMPAGNGNRVNGLGAQFLGQALQLFAREIPHIAWDRDTIEQRCDRTVHSASPRDCVTGQRAQMRRCFPKRIQMILRLGGKPFRLQPGAFKSQKPDQSGLACIGVLAGALAGFLG